MIPMMWRLHSFLLYQTALVVFLPSLLVDGLHCPLPETAEGAEDYVSICAMCSDSAAAVRWRVRENASFSIMLLRYTCTDSNGTEIYAGSSRIRDPCFDPYPDVDKSSTGTTGVGYELWTGIQCEFRVAYRINAESIIETTTCTVKGCETCAESPDECSIDRVSSLNGEGECEFQCTIGYSGQLCNDIDECSGSNVCDGNADCHDTDGSYWCECRPGFQGDGYNCTDIDECAGNMCADNADCHDIDGSYWCECRPGFQGDGYNCTDVCEIQEVRCGDNAECISKGSFSCQCKPGFTGDGYNCTDINECLNVPCSGENSECVNTEGNYSCQCEPGFTGDGYNCIDINECSNDHHTCPDGSYCINLNNGSYHCKPNVSSKMAVVTTAVIICIVAMLLMLVIVILLIIPIQHRPWFMRFTLATVNNEWELPHNQEHTQETKNQSWGQGSLTDTAIYCNV